MSEVAIVAVVVLVLSDVVWAGLGAASAAAPVQMVCCSATPLPPLLAWGWLAGNASEMLGEDAADRLLVASSLLVDAPDRSMMMSPKPGESKSGSCWSPPP